MRPTILFLLISTLSFSQEEPIGLISNNFLTPIYLGYANYISTSVESDSIVDYYLECDKCDSVVRFDRGSYRVYTNTSGFHFLQIRRVSDSTSISIKRFISKKVRPEIKLGAFSQGDTLSVIPSMLFIKFKPEVNLFTRFAVKSWEISAGNMKFSGDFREIRTEIIDELGKLKYGAPIYIKVYGFSPNGNIELDGVFYAGDYSKGYKAEPQRASIDCE